MTETHIRIFDTVYQNSPCIHDKRDIFNHIMDMIRHGREDGAMRHLKQFSEFLNIGENKLDFTSVGRFTTPFLAAATHGRTELLRNLIADEELSPKIDWLTQSHCGQQVLAHSVVNKEVPKQKQLKAVKILIEGAKENLSPEQFKEFIFGGGVWGRTPLYNALVESENTEAATLILNTIKEKGWIGELRGQRLQLGRPIGFYLHNTEQMDILLGDLSKKEKKDYLSITDDVGNTALHWARDEKLAQEIMTHNPHAALVENYDGYTPAVSLALASYTPASEAVMNSLKDEKKSEVVKKIKHLTEKRACHKALANIIKAIEKRKVVSDNDMHLLAQPENYDRFNLGTKVFLSEYLPHQFSLSDDLKQEFNAIEQETFIPGRGFENEFHMPQETEHAIKSMNCILNHNLEPHIFSFGQDPEPSILPNNPTEMRVEINSPIIKDGKTLQKWYQLNDIAQDLGANKNATSGIHVHVGCKDSLRHEDIGISKDSSVSLEEIQIAFLKSFLHAFTIARPAFDNTTVCGLRPDYHATAVNHDTDIIAHPNVVERFCLSDHDKSKQHLYVSYLNDVNQLNSFKDIPQFIEKIGREKYVSVALPKDTKGTLEVRELKTRFTNEIGMNNQELKNIFNFINALTKLTLLQICNNPPVPHQNYEPDFQVMQDDIKNIAHQFEKNTLDLLEHPQTIKSSALKKHLAEKRLIIPKTKDFRPKTLSSQGNCIFR
jgi:hypothetical protein